MRYFISFHYTSPEGYYADHIIEALFTTREEAMKFAEELNDKLCIELGIRLNYTIHEVC